MHKLYSPHAFLHFILEQNEWNLPSVWSCWLPMRAQALNTSSSTAQANTDPSCHVDTRSPRSLSTAQLSQEQSWIQTCCSESISIHLSTQPAHLPNMSHTPFSLFWDIFSSISGYISDPHPMQAIHSQHMTADSHTVCEAARKLPWLPTWSRAFFNNSVLCTCTPAKWLTGFLWREISLAGTTARLHCLYQQRGKLTQHKHSVLDQDVEKHSSRQKTATKHLYPAHSKKSKGWFQDKPLW